MDTTFGKYLPYGTMNPSTSQKLAGRTSLISSWRSSLVARAFYDSCQSNELDVKLRIPNLGHQLLPKLQAGDPDATGLCSKQHLLKVLLLHFNVLLTPGEQDCLIAEWQVMDHVTGEVDYRSLCVLATTEE